MTTKRHGWKLVKKSKFWGFLWRHHPNSDVINLKLGTLSSFIKVYNWWKFQGQSISGSWDLRGGGGFGGGQNARGIIRAKTCEGLIHRQLTFSWLFGYLLRSQDPAWMYNLTGCLTNHFNNIAYVTMLGDFWILSTKICAIVMSSSWKTLIQSFISSFVIQYHIWKYVFQIFNKMINSIYFDNLPKVKETYFIKKDTLLGLLGFR